MLNGGVNHELVAQHYGYISTEQAETNKIAIDLCHFLLLAVCNHLLVYANQTLSTAKRKRSTPETNLQIRFRTSTSDRGKLPPRGLRNL